MHYLSWTILNVQSGDLSASQYFSTILIQKREVKVKRGKYVEREMEQVHVCQSLRKNQCVPEPRVKVVPIKYASITPLNLLTFPLSTP